MCTHVQKMQQSLNFLSHYTNLLFLLVHWFCLLYIFVSRHKCPHNQQGNVSIGNSQQPCAFSEYSQEYKTHPLERRQLIRPEAKPVSGDGVMDDKTTNRYLHFIFIIGIWRVLITDDDPSRFSSKNDHQISFLSYGTLFLMKCARYPTFPLILLLIYHF